MGVLNFRCLIGLLWVFVSSGYASASILSCDEAERIRPRVKRNTLVGYLGTGIKGFFLWQGMSGWSQVEGATVPGGLESPATSDSAVLGGSDPFEETSFCLGLLGSAKSTVGEDWPLKVPLAEDEVPMLLFKEGAWQIYFGYYNRATMQLHGAWHLAGAQEPSATYLSRESLVYHTDFFWGACPTRYTSTFLWGWHFSDAIGEEDLISDASYQQAQVSFHFSALNPLLQDFVSFHPLLSQLFVYDREEDAGQRRRLTFFNEELEGVSRVRLPVMLAVEVSEQLPILSREGLETSEALTLQQFQNEHPFWWLDPEVIGFMVKEEGVLAWSLVILPLAVRIVTFMRFLSVLGWTSAVGVMKCRECMRRDRLEGLEHLSKAVEETQSNSTEKRVDILPV